MFEWLQSVDWGSLWHTTCDAVADEWFAIVTFLISCWALCRAALASRWNWRNRRLMSMVTVSVIFYDKKTENIVVRDIDERPAIEVWQNAFGVHEIMKKARKVTREKPFLVLPKESAEQILEACRSSLSSIFAREVLQRAAGRDMPVSWFLFGIAYKPFGNRDSGKTRVIVVCEKDLPRLAALAKDPDTGLEGVSSGWRANALKELQRLYHSEFRERSVMRVELPVKLKTAE